MTGWLRRLTRRPRLVPRRRLCGAGLHADLQLVEVRVHPGDCRSGVCLGWHEVQRCPECGATWDARTGDRIRSEALS